MSHTSDHYTYIVHHIRECFHIPAYLFDISGILLCPLTVDSPINLQFFQTMIDTCHHYPKTDIALFPQVLIPSDNIYFVFFPLEKEHFMLLGPIGSNYLTARQNNDFRKKYHFEFMKNHFCRLSVSQLMSLTSIVWFMVSKTPIKTEDIYIRKDFSFQLTEADSSGYRLYSYKEDKTKSNFEGEQIWCNYIETGDVQKMNEMISHTQNIVSSFESVGTLAKDNDYKQLEYTLVTSISLAMHAAIRGGVAPLQCYEASDLLLQKAAACTDILKLYDLFIETFRTFTTMVHLHIHSPKYGLLIEQCKDYIARHLYHPFRIADMSAQLHINNNYLSQLFSRETGMTIQHYIRNERLNAAANLLKYSEESIGQISDYMQFSSPSRFSGYFKEKYHMTPLEYRNKYKIAEFKDKPR